MRVGDISLIIKGQIMDAAPHPHPIKNLPKINAQKLNIVFMIAPMMITRSTNSKAFFLPIRTRGLMVKVPIMAPKGIIVVTIQLKLLRSSKKFSP